MKKRQPRRLAGGGVIKLPKGEVGKSVAGIMRQFRSCGPEGNKSALVAPPPSYVPACVRASGVYICVEPTDKVSWSAKGDLVTGGYYSPSGKQIRLKVEANQCSPRTVWAERMRNVLRHEMTHAQDPYVHVRRKPYAKAEKESDYCDYVRDPAEVAAFLAETQEELLNSTRRRSIERQVRKGVIERPEEILHESPTYLRVLNCLTPKLKRRFLQMAARLWASGKLGPLPGRR